VVILTGPAF